MRNDQQHNTDLTTQTDHPYWPTWARFLQQHGLDRIAFSLLESTGPLAVIGAQVIYLGEPFLNQAFPARNLQALADLFENQAEMKSFAAYLRETKQP